MRKLVFFDVGLFVIAFDDFLLDLGGVFQHYLYVVLFHLQMGELNNNEDVFRVN